MKTIQLEVKDDYLENILNFLKLLPENVAKIKPELCNRITVNSVYACA